MPRGQYKPVTIPYTRTWGFPMELQDENSGFLRIGDLDDLRLLRKSSRTTDGKAAKNAGDTTADATVDVASDVSVNGSVATNVDTNADTPVDTTADDSAHVSADITVDTTVEAFTPAEDTLENPNYANDVKEAMTRLMLELSQEGANSSTIPLTQKGERLDEINRKIELYRNYVRWNQDKLHAINSRINEKQLRLERERGAIAAEHNEKCDVILAVIEKLEKKRWELDREFEYEQKLGRYVLSKKSA